jgi:hypothetical protein
MIISDLSYSKSASVAIVGGASSGGAYQSGASGTIQAFGTGFTTNLATKTLSKVKFGVAVVTGPGVSSSITSSKTVFKSSFASNTTSSTALGLGTGGMIPAIATTAGNGFANA